jgi:hypothetical protein
MRAKLVLGVLALGVVATAVGAGAATDRPLTPLSATQRANRHGPCRAAVGLVPDSGCPGGGRPKVAGCDVFPADNAWNTDITSYARHPSSDAFIAAIEAARGTPGEAHLYFGAAAGGDKTGMPYIVVPPNQPLVNVTYDAFGAESDPGPFPIPLDAPVETNGDRHVLALQSGTCKVFEMYNARPTANGWVANSGVVWNLSSNALRPDRTTSADAAGLSIFAGVAKYEEVAAGAINHALRVSVRVSQSGFIHPATHFSGNSTNPNAPPMGLRLRLRADFDRSSFTGQARVIVDALAKYGAIVADNGFNWILYGGPDPGWDYDDLTQLYGVPGTAFEAVETGPIIT